MEIYFINSKRFLKHIDINSLNYFQENRIFGSTKRAIEFSLGRFILKYILQNKYNINSPTITINNKKPCLKDKTNIHFSITHSNGLIMCVFDENEIGIDIEQKKERNFEKLFNFYKITPNKKDKNTFYQLWTEYEAKIKLQKQPKSTKSFNFGDNYSLSICSCVEIDIKNKLKIYELKIPTHNIKPNELINLKLVIESNKNENTVVIQDINTAEYELEFLPPLNLKIE